MFISTARLNESLQDQSRGSFLNCFDIPQSEDVGIRICFVFVGISGCHCEICLFISHPVVNPDPVSPDPKTWDTTFGFWQESLQSLMKSRG